jgi:hypothetical protein
MNKSQQQSLTEVQYRPNVDDEDDSDAEYSFDGVNLKPHRLDRFGRPLAPVAKRKLAEGETDEEQPHATTSPSAPLQPMQIRITPYVPRKNTRAIRERSWEALEAVRRQVEMETGSGPKLIVDNATGMLLPRDQVVGADEPLHSGIEAQHYQRSLDIVGEIRSERMMRFFQGA